MAMKSKYDYVGSVTRKQYLLNSPTPQQVGFTLDEIAYYLRAAIAHFLFIMPLQMAANENRNPQPVGGDAGNQGDNLP